MNLPLKFSILLAIRTAFHSLREGYRDNHSDFIKTALSSARLRLPHYCSHRRYSSAPTNNAVSSHLGRLFRAVFEKMASEASRKSRVWSAD